MGRIESVNVVHELLPDEHNGQGRTAIDKRPVTGPVHVGPVGLTSDRQMDIRHHGGRDKAVYAYAAEDLAWWSESLGRALTPGRFGENLTTSGIDVTGALVGERWQVTREGGPLLEVTQPRTPCATFQAWLGEPRWVRRFTQRGVPGAYLRVLTEGEVGAGDEVEIVHRPTHGVSIGDFFTRLDAAMADRVLAAESRGEVELAESLRAYAEHAASRG
ncbi:MAG TPA: MOSC domain-containing protein [Actinomycetales bacterium]|jgi:MOSC domain-containing protein YiiM